MDPNSVYLGRSRSEVGVGVVVGSCGVEKMIALSPVG